MSIIVALRVLIVKYYILLLHNSLNIRPPKDLLYCHMMKALHLAKPHVLVMIGGPASGKSTFATKFADTFHAPYIDAKQFHLATGDQTSALELAYDMLEQMHKTNQTIVYEGVSGTKTERTEIAKLARKHGYEPLFIWVQTDPNVAFARATKRTRSNPNPMSEDAFDRETRRFTAPSSPEPVVVISGMHTYASQAKAVLRKLAEQREGTPQTPQPPQPRTTAQSGGRRSVTIQ